MSPDTSMDFTNVEIKSKFLKVMRERGYLYQCTDISSLDDMLSDEGGGSVKAYIGFDATGEKRGGREESERRKRGGRHRLIVLFYRIIFDWYF